MESGRARQQTEQGARAVQARGHRDMHFPVILNGLDYVYSSLTSLANKPNGRDLKYAVLHLQLGLETLLKARLELHNPCLVWSNQRKFNKALHRQGAFHSVGVEGALTRLRDDVRVQNPIDPKDADLDALGALRNRLTHYRASDTVVAVEARTVPVLDKLLPFIDNELLPNDTSDDATAAVELMEQIRPLIGRAGAYVRHRLAELEPVLKEHAETALQCLSCGHPTMVAEGGADVFVCRLCGKSYDGIEELIEFYGQGSFYTAVAEGGEPPAYECAECSSGTETVLPVQTAAVPKGSTLVCVLGGHVLKDICDTCKRAANLDLDMCTDCLGNRYARF
ncbi:hypothetical protein ACWDQL_30020 [Streptomyces olivaceus]